ncbi:hypothetical protein ACTWOG_000954 [Serratia marcescens]
MNNKMRISRLNVGVEGFHVQNKPAPAPSNSAPTKPSQQPTQGDNKKKE